MREERIDLAGLRFSDNRNYGGEGDIKRMVYATQDGLVNLPAQQIFMAYQKSMAGIELLWPVR